MTILSQSYDDLNTVAWLKANALCITLLILKRCLPAVRACTAGFNSSC